MEKVLNSFMNENEESFSEFFEKHRETNLLNREDYLELKNQKNTIYEKYPQIREFIEDMKPINFDKEEAESFWELERIFNQIQEIEIKEA